MFRHADHRRPSHDDHQSTADEASLLTELLTTVSCTWNCVVALCAAREGGAGAGCSAHGGVRTLTLTMPLNLLLTELTYSQLIL